MEPTTATIWMAIIIIIFIVITICVPFYILKIRNQVVDMNKKMTLMTEYLRMMAEEPKSAMKKKNPTGGEYRTVHKL